MNLGTGIVVTLIVLGLLAAMALMNAGNSKR
jgi:hypothetical protein